MDLKNFSKMLPYSIMPIRPVEVSSWEMDGRSGKSYTQKCVMCLPNRESHFDLELKVPADVGEVGGYKVGSLYFVEGDPEQVKQGNTGRDYSPTRWAFPRVMSLVEYTPKMVSQTMVYSVFSLADMPFDTPVSKT